MSLAALSLEPFQGLCFTPPKVKEIGELLEQLYALVDFILAVERSN